jgi:hypothetical protein
MRAEPKLRWEHRYGAEVHGHKDVVGAELFVHVDEYDWSRSGRSAVSAVRGGREVHVGHVVRETCGVMTFWRAWDLTKWGPHQVGQFFTLRKAKLAVEASYKSGRKP